MTNIPLFCNICPRDPVFSDVSHLLTHVASKGHLAQHNKAKLRARQDASFRERLEAYERWYQRHQIERLLSERMIAKDSKDSNSRVRMSKPASRSSALTKEPEPRKRRAKKAERLDQGLSPVKAEGPIDPQLSHLDQFAGPSNGRTPSIERPMAGYDDSHTQRTPTSAVTPRQINQSALFYPQHHHDHHHSHRAPIPHMSSWQGGSPTLHAVSVETIADSIRSPPPAQNDGTDYESDYFQTFLRSPSRTAYPDPSEVTGFRTGFSISSSSPIIKADDMNHAIHSIGSKDEMSRTLKSASQSPVLRGVKWPGMSIFDSANVEAQRLRNQKKTDSVIEQMEHNSAMVEQLERIYWPDGSLKMQRLITGEVESSPIRELTPPPKLSKRRRIKTTKSILQDLSTNIPTMTKKPRARKATIRMPVVQTSELQNISRKVLTSLDPPKCVYPRSAQVGDKAPKGEDIERRMTCGLPIGGRRRDFDVFSDHEGGHAEARSESTPKMHSQAFTQSSHGHHRATYADDLNGNAHREPYSSHPQHTATRLKAPSQKAALGSYACDYAKKARLPFIDEDSENIEPILDGDGRIDDKAAFNGHERVTQRYFSVTGNQPPQFFSSMPPGMDFGVATDPKYYGSTLNPLNTYLRQQLSVSLQPQTGSLSQTQKPPEGGINNAQNLMQPALHPPGDGGRVKGFRR